MEVVDKEQQRAGEKEPGKKGSNLLVVIILIICAAFLGGLYYVDTYTLIFSGKPYTVNVAGAELVPGQTTAQDLQDMGFVVCDSRSKKLDVVDGEVSSSYVDPISTSESVKGDSYLLMLKLVKDGQGYADLTIMNESSSAKEFGKCKVRSVTLYYGKENEQTASVDGISMTEMSLDKLIQSAGKPKGTKEKVISDENMTLTSWKNRSFNLELTVKADGTVYSVTSGYKMD